MLLATVLYFGSLVLGMLAVVTLPRLLRLIVRPDRDYRLYGLRYWAHRTIARMTNRRVFTRLYGDSSYIVHYLRAIGYDLSERPADRVELRHRGQARQPVPDHGGQQDGGRRRALG